jgi:helicase
MRIEELSQYGITQSLIDKLNSLGFRELTDIQEQAIKKGLFEGKNLVVSAPTNTGKTFIGELAVLHSYRQRRGGRTFCLVPLKALAEEKFLDFNEKYSAWGLTVAITTGERTEYDANLLDHDLIIATYEKMNGLLVKYPNLVDSIGVVIVDEIQNISDRSRGVSLEILLTRLLKANEKQKPQIVGLSATCTNAADLANWLSAVLVDTDKRNVELREGILYTGDAPVFFAGCDLVKGDIVYRELNSGKTNIEKLNLNNAEVLNELCKTEQVLFFTNTRLKAERLALKLSDVLPTATNITKWIDELDAHVEPTPSLKSLKKCLTNSVAFHHAGMLREEKRIVEKAFEEGDIRVICATTTLGAGINTPAKSVIILDNELWDSTPIFVRDYKNMAGRAGRIGYHDDFGRSVMFAGSEKELEMLWNGYVNRPAEPIGSVIQEKETIELHILNLVASQVCKGVEQILDFIRSTFFGHIYYQMASQEFRGTFDQTIRQQIDKLHKDGFLRIENGRIQATELGRRCAELQLSPESVRVLFFALKKLYSKFQSYKTFDVLIEPVIHLACCSRDAQLLYLPRSQQEKKEIWYYWECNKNSYLVSLDESYESERILQTTKTVQLLMRWIEGVPYSDLRAFDQQGRVKAIGENASWIVRALVRLQDEPLFKFGDEFAQFLTILAERLNFGVPREAVEIMRLNIPAIHRFRAIKLASQGYSTLDSLLQASIQDLKKVPDVGDILANRIKEHVEKFITNENERARSAQIRHADKLGRPHDAIDRLYTETGDAFARACVDVLGQHIGLQCRFIGDISPHEPDGLVETGKDKIAIECKRKKGLELVSAGEAEEILGKGAKYNPIAYVTIGYPRFSHEAVSNVKNTHITLLTHTALADILLHFWEGKLSKDNVLEILKRGTHLPRVFLGLA